jgi:multicomponent Na+:H+ antiporter subunit C
MDGWLEFALERYNYWIVILLMMTGLYIVVARGNLVKKIVGLNLFQTSVFIFYISIGKIAGGTAPIYIGGELDHNNGHEGDGHEGGDAPHGEDLHQAPDAGGQPIGEETGDSLHSKIDNVGTGNDLKEALKDLGPANDAQTAPSLHEAPAGVDADKISNDALATLAKPDAMEFDVSGSLHGADSANALADALHSTGDIIYTNPLPHVLILTAIVVGVATLALGLALVVRINEAYGTIEEDEIMGKDREA